MGLFLLRFWPVFIPVAVYWLWLVTVGKKAKKAGQKLPRFRDGPWYWMVLASLLISVGCFAVLGSSIDNVRGSYTPPHMHDGAVVPAQVGNGQ